MRLQSAIFDMDGTLLDSMWYWRSVCPTLLRKQGIDVPPAFQAQLMTLTLREGAQLCKDTYHLPESVDEIIAQTEALVEDFYLHQVELKPGVKKFLSLLKMEGVWMYVATNTSRPLVEKALKRTGIDGYFRGVLTCGEVGAGKADSPEIYERALRRLQSTKKDTVVFEDAVHAIRTAKAAGFRVCAVYDASAASDQEEIRQRSDYYIQSFEEMFESQTF